MSKIIMAVLVGVIAYLVCIFVGGVLLVGLEVPIAVSVGNFLNTYAGVISVICAVWYYFSGTTFNWRS